MNKHAMIVYAMTAILSAWITHEVGQLVSGQQPRAGIEETSDRDSLGERLFNDKALSANGDTSCATCHLREKAFASDGLPPKQGGGKLARKGPSLLNAKDHPFLFWDGRAKSLEEQVIQPITNKDEMGNATLEPVLVRLAERYKRDFTSEQLATLLADHVRTLTSKPARVDRYVKGENVLTAAERRGWDVFHGKGHCNLCHSGKNFTDEKFHNTGIGSVGGENFVIESGRAAITGDRADAGKFKTPGLRETAKTGPYMHDCSLKDLPAVIEFYDRGGSKNPALDKEIKPLKLTPQDKSDLLAFLRSI